jgi:hypothetical protein
MIRFYNIHSAHKFLKQNPKQLSPFVKDDFDAVLFNNYEKFGLNKSSMQYDRSGALPHFLKISPGLHPMPARVENYNKSFYDVAEERAKELVSLNKPINVMWSGGIDSTFVLFMLKQYANDPEQIRVYGTYNSIIESGNLFDKKIKDNFIYNIKVNSLNRFNFETDGIYVSGQLSNNLFGPQDDDFSHRHLNQPGGFHTIVGTLETVYDPIERALDPEFLEFFDDLIKASPRPIETVADFRWYCQFNLGWYTNCYYNKIQLTPNKVNNIYAFFDTEEFQKWAISTKEPFTKTPGDISTHRWQIKEVLAEQFGVEHYAKYKAKRNSVFNAFDPSWLFLLENYENLYLK